MASKRSPKKALRIRLGPQERRAQIVAVAGELLSRKGVDALQFTDVAQAAGVSRPIVYKFFPTRNALLEAVLVDFEEELTRRFFAVARASVPGTLEEMTGVFINAICDTIEAKGAGAWELLDASGPDPEVAQLGRTIQARIMSPWYASIAQTTGAKKREVITVTNMLVAAGRAVLALWYAGSLSRREAARDATRGVSALLAAFTVSPGDTRTTAESNARSLVGKRPVNT